MIIENCGGNGVHLKNSNQNTISGTITDCDGDGVALDDSAHNLLTYLNIVGNLSGLVISGTNSNHNLSERVHIGAIIENPTFRIRSFKKHTSHGIHLHNDAHANSFLSTYIFETGDHAVLLEDPGTSNNTFNDLHVGTIYGRGTYSLADEVSWPPRSGGDGIVIRRGATMNAFNFCIVNNQAGNGVVVQDSGSDINTFHDIRIGMCKKREAPDRDLYQNNGWGVVVKQGPKDLLFENIYAGFNLLGGYLVENNRINDKFGVYNISLIHCYTGYLEFDHNNLIQNEQAKNLAGGAGYELFDSTNVFLESCYAWGYENGIWIHGPDSKHNEVSFCSFRDPQHAGVFIEGSRGDRIDHPLILFREPDRGIQRFGYLIKDSLMSDLFTLRRSSFNTNETPLRIESSESIFVGNTEFTSASIHNQIEISNSINVMLFKNTIKSAGENAILISDDSDGVSVDQCTLEGSKNNGIHILDSQNVIIRKGESQWNKENGIHIENGKNISIHDVFFFWNSNCGLSIIGEFTNNVILTGSRFTKNHIGINATHGKRLVIGPEFAHHHDMNYFIQNNYAAISMSGMETEATIINNAIGLSTIDSENPMRFNNNGHGVILTDGITGALLQSNHIVFSKSHGILLMDGANANVMMRNVIHENLQHGVFVEGTETTNNVISRNSISGNKGRGITLVDGGNSMQVSPVIEKVTWRGESISGRVDAPNGSIVEVYSDSGNQGINFAGMGTVMHNHFQLSGDYDPTMRLNAIVITPDGNTSEFGASSTIQPEYRDSFVFTGEQDGNKDIYYQGDHNSPPIRLTFHSADEYSPHALRNGTGILFVTERLGNPDIFLYRTAQHDVIPITSDINSEIDPHLEPNDKTMLYVSNATGKQNIYRMIFSPSESSNLIAFEDGPIDDGRLRPIGYKHAMKINSPPDGIVDSLSFYIQNQPAPFRWAIHEWDNNKPSESILIEGMATPDTIGWYEIDIDNTTVPTTFAVVITILEYGKPILGNSEFTFDTTNGLFLGVDYLWEWDYAENLMIRVAFDTPPPIRLTDNHSDNRYPAASPTGEEIAFSSYQNDSWDIWIMNNDGSNLRQITFDHSDNIKPAWSSNGAYILFESDRNGNADVYQINKDGTNVQRLTQYVGQDTSPVWSLDGKRVLFSSDRGAGPEIYRMDNDEMALSRLTFVTGSATQPHAAPFIPSLPYNALTPPTAKMKTKTNRDATSEVVMNIDIHSSPKIAKPGDTVEVSIHAANIDHIANLMLEIRFDPTIFRLLSVEPSELFLSDSLISKNLSSLSHSTGLLRWNWAQPFGLLGESNVLFLSFEIFPEVDETETHVFLAAAEAFNTSLQAIEFTHSDITIEINSGDTAVDHWMIYEEKFTHPFVFPQ
jgi:Tol biopolymer transport system component